MEYSPGCVFSLAEKNAPIPGCTVSEAICSGETDVVRLAPIRKTHCQRGL